MDLQNGDRREKGQSKICQFKNKDEQIFTQMFVSSQQQKHRRNLSSMVVGGSVLVRQDFMPSLIYW